MTHPLTPREKVAAAVREASRSQWNDGVRVGSAKWCNHLTDAILAALASSGDHAELARLADDLRKFEHHAVGSLKIGMDEVRRIIAACDAHAALLAENAALRAQNDVLEIERIGLRSAIFGSPDYDPSLRHGNFIEMARATEDARQGALARATEAERKLAEAVGRSDDLLKALEWYGEQARLARLIHSEGDAGRHALADDGGSRARAFIANHGPSRARTFISKEAERG